MHFRAFFKDFSGDFLPVGIPKQKWTEQTTKITSTHKSVKIVSQKSIGGTLKFLVYIFKCLYKLYLTFKFY